MRYKVIEAFSTPQRRFAVGMEIDGAEIDGPVPVERWVQMKRLGPIGPGSRSAAAIEASAETVEPSARGRASAG